jgi:hypothetical protein
VWPVEVSLTADLDGFGAADEALFDESNVIDAVIVVDA